MAVANKFWTMVYEKNTPKIGIVLIYTVLEWILIALLLLDGVFSYLIAAFAEFFRLEPPCFLCSRALGGAQLNYCSRHLSREEEEEEEEEKDDLFVKMVVEDASMDAIVLPRMMEAEERLVPVDQERSILVEWVDSLKKSDEFNTSRNDDEDLVQEEVDDQERLVLSRNDDEDLVQERVDDQERLLLSRNDDHRDEDEEQPEATVPVAETSFKNSSLFHPIFFQQYGEFQAANEEDGKMIDIDTNCEISIGSEIGYQEEHIGISNPVLVPFPNEVNEEERTHERVLFERREFGGTESLDGSVASLGSELLNVDHLKAALKSEREALSALYAELEEERSASAVAANQTMAMITRLQEEKAAMQMEALQYQRMMEEQLEYGQLMMKREKELEGDIDISSDSQDGGGEDRNLISLDDSLADFEEERSSILEQLKALEEKLSSSLDGDDDSKKNSSNGHGTNYGRFRCKPRRSLLPLFDATVLGMESDSLDQKKLAIAEEVDSVYERLYALESDREFLKHCMLTSLKKEDQGMDLLQEILRDLRNVQLRVRNAGYALDSLSP